VLSQAQDALRRESKNATEEHWRLQMWATMLREATLSEKAAAQAR
jgi:hypothetical protein